MSVRDNDSSAVKSFNGTCTDGFTVAKFLMSPFSRTTRRKEESFGTSGASGEPARLPACLLLLDVTDTEGTCPIRLSSAQIRYRH